MKCPLLARTRQGVLRRRWLLLAAGVQLAAATGGCSEGPTERNDASVRAAVLEAHDAARAALEPVPARELDAALRQDGAAPDLDASAPVLENSGDGGAADGGLDDGALESLEPMSLAETDWDAGAAEDASADEAVVEEPSHEPRWVTTWSTALVQDSLSALLRSFHRVTLRQIVHTSVAGERVRVRLSNHFGKKPLYIGAAHIAQRADGSSIVKESDRRLTFAGKGSVVIPRGQARVSDPVPLEVPALTDLAVSLYFAERTVVENIHRESSQTNYLSAPGNFVASADLPAGSDITNWFFLEGVEVESTTATGTVVAFGDSITDGYASTVDAAERWPDELSRRLVETGRQLGVANEGYAGNQLLATFAGEAGLLRFERDVLGNTGVTHVILAEGINDIGLSNASSEQVIGALKVLIGRAHRANLMVLGGTLCPFQGSFFYSDQREAVRLAVNEWIRTSGAYDGIVDFESALLDSLNGARLLSAYDSGDKLHPSDLGYEVMGQSVDLSLLDQTRPPAWELGD